MDEAQSWVTPIPQATSQQETTAPPDWTTPIPQAGILAKPTQVTQSFGTVNPIEPTAGHRAGDTNFAAKEGDTIAVPPGQWEVVKAYNGASPNGSPGDYQDNSGWGNDVWLKDPQTGQTLHFLHMASVNASPGQVIKGGTVVGTVGASGNATGPNLGVEYYDKDGKMGDVMQSGYAQNLPVIGSSKDPLAH